MAVVVDFVQQVADIFLLGLGVHGRVAALIVGQAGDVDAVALPGDGHGRHVAVVLAVFQAAIDAKAVRLHIAAPDLGPVDDLDLVGRGDDHLFGHVPHLGVGHDQNRRAVLFRQVEGADGQIEQFLGRRGRQGDDGVIAVGPPAGLHHILLADQGGQPGGRPAPLDVDQDAGRLQHDAQAQVLHHQRKAGAAGGRHGLGPGPRRAQDGVHGGQFILHLDIDAAHLGQPDRHPLRDLGGRGDGIAGEKAAAGQDGALGGGVIAQQKMLACQQALLLAHPFTSILWIGSTLSGGCAPPSST